MKILVANIGSSSRKYALFDGKRMTASARLESTGSAYTQIFTAAGKSSEAVSLSRGEYEDGAGRVLAFFLESHVLENAQAIQAIALRVVAPGTYFQSHRMVDDAYLEKLDRVRKYAPLHVEPVFHEAQRLRELFPTKKIIGISDSAFHAVMPPMHRNYALPAEDAKRWDVYRFGYHGLSVQSCLRKIIASGSLPSRIILCHLGSGASVTAIRDGKCVDTSMGFSPLEGLIMGTRIGDFDPGAVLYLAKTSGMDLVELESYFNSKCGLLGLSGLSSDLRLLLAKEVEGNAEAHAAIDGFIDRIKKYIGGYFAILGGLDLLVFTGAIGERSVMVRRRVCLGLEGLGILLSDNLNADRTSGDGYIQATHSSAATAVIATGEMDEMAAQAEDLIRRNA